MKERVIRTAVVGSGCAGLNAADWLSALGERDLAIVTEDLYGGTSRNTGSDKQTYYKLSLAGDDGDSVGEMAKTLARSDVNADTALCEAAGSARCFMKLAELGVPFPRNAYGEYVGYQTDHDTRRRATSAGPLTSRYMTEALERSVLSRGVEVLDHTLVCRVVTDRQGVAGLVCLDLEKKEWLFIRCAHIVLCTGGPAMIYRDSVYPESQRGMSGMAFEAGAAGANLDCWQYGLASVDFRWNLSGSYQQAIPRYVSVDAEGNEREFLADALGEKQALDLTFLKGYQWPFDPRKAEGSSRVDILVKAETDAGRRVCLDYTRDPRGYSPSALSEEARDYLTRCGAADGARPFDRLFAMNAPAIDLFRAYGIDLERDRLQARVCAQHHNGGIAVDADWQTRVPGLYACGEAAGTFGRFRPGGTALNSTQVGSMRAAEHIARRSRRTVNTAARAELPSVPSGDPAAAIAELQGDMSRFAAFLRDAEGIRGMLGKLDALEKTLRPAEEKDPLLEERLRLADLMRAQREVLSAMLESLANDTDRGVLMTLNGKSERVAAREAAGRDLWFERVWRACRQQEG